MILIRWVLNIHNIKVGNFFNVVRVIIITIIFFAIVVRVLLFVVNFFNLVFRVVVRITFLKFLLSLPDHLVLLFLLDLLQNIVLVRSPVVRESLRERCFTFIVCSHDFTIIWVRIIIGIHFVDTATTATQIILITNEWCVLLLSGRLSDFVYASSRARLYLFQV